MVRDIGIYISLARQIGNYLLCDLLVCRDYSIIIMLRWEKRTYEGVWPSLHPLLSPSRGAQAPSGEEPRAHTDACHAGQVEDAVGGVPPGSWRVQMLDKAPV